MLVERFAAQLLTGPPAPDPLAVAERLLAIQGQDPRGARLAIRVRTAGLSAADVDHALTHDRSLLITWLNRGTLHLVRSEDYPWLQALTAPLLRAGNARRLAEEGVDPGAAERGVAVIERALTDDGPQTRPQLRDRLDAAGVPTAGQALIHLLMLSCLRGIAVRGPMVGTHHAYALVRDWLGEGASAPVDRDRALAELVRRFLAGHGPADDRDLAKWSGLGLRDVRAGLSAIAAQLVERPDGLLDLADRAARAAPGAAAASVPPPRLLGAYDPLLHGWTSRDPILAGHAGIVTVNGLFRPFALVDGKAAAIWSLAGGRISLKPFGPLAAKDAAALEAEAADVTRFLAA